MQYFVITAFFVLGAILGSFASAIIHRIKNNQSWIVTNEGGAARSNCPQCNHNLSIFDLIPIFSWLLNKGRCRYCKEEISYLYIILEFACAALSISVYFVCGLSFETAFLVLLLPFFISQIALLFLVRRLSKQLFFIMLGLVMLYIAINYT